MDTLTALPDATNDLTLPCHEQRAGAATADSSGNKEPESESYSPEKDLHLRSKRRGTGKTFLLLVVDINA